MTTEPLPARHCIARVLELQESNSTVDDVERCPHAYPYTILHARTLEEYGYQEPLDPIRKRAREICAGVCEAQGYPRWAIHFRAGDWDDYSMMQATEKALREPGL